MISNLFITFLFDVNKREGEREMLVSYSVNLRAMNQPEKKRRHHFFGAQIDGSCENVSNKQ